MTLTRGRQTAYALAGLLLFYVAVEGLAVGAWRIHFGQRFSFAAARALRDRAVVDSTPQRAAPPWWAMGQVVHPYFGFAYDPEVFESTDPTGFLTANPVIQEPAPDKFVVVITGGSLAGYIAGEGDQALIAQLAGAAPVHGKQVQLVNITSAGFKQPQQLTALAYLLALGAHIDAVVNVDGFNEAALPAAENLPAGTFPFYPRSWHVYAAEITDHRTLRQAARVQAARDARLAGARLAGRAPWRWSVTVQFLWGLLDEARARQIYESVRELSSPAGPRRSYRLHGPPVSYPSDEAMLREMARMWARASRVLHRLLAANGIVYVHALQPNQYDLEGKPLSEEEQRTAWSAASPYRPLIERGYRFFREEGAQLAREGEPFVDLTRLFAAERGTLYKDTCCHLYAEGNRRLGAAVGAALRAALEARPPR